ncbi:MAG: hypothetical protein EBV32_00425 [Proteobacteria bacterium]|uniref:Uncharacterized protein n=1 Tax=Candidatus Fonsibacter lacus TaxID=2576439 RepID=A0A964UZ21_9PROT|nr:hypothetical protein [Candidatus Fonsibacter lacus]NCU71662.1 hypothetical protein [Candidatus Fonsibacter lacus]
MSTYINVTVGKTGLSDKAKQQTNANRQAKLEADARDKAEVEGKRQRDANRAEQGIGPDGKPLYGQPLQTAARKDEPAAFRQIDTVIVNGIGIKVEYSTALASGDVDWTVKVSIGAFTSTEATQFIYPYRTNAWNVAPTPSGLPTTWTALPRDVGLVDQYGNYFLDSSDIFYDDSNHAGGTYSIARDISGNLDLNVNNSRLIPLPDGQGGAYIIFLLNRLHRKRVDRITKTATTSRSLASYKRVGNPIQPNLYPGWYEINWSTNPTCSAESTDFNMTPESIAALNKVLAHYWAGVNTVTATRAAVKDLSFSDYAVHLYRVSKQGVVAEVEVPTTLQSWLQSINPPLEINSTVTTSSGSSVNLNSNWITSGTYEKTNNWDGSHGDFCFPNIQYQEVVSQNTIQPFSYSTFDSASYYASAPVVDLSTYENTLLFLLGGVSSTGYHARGPSFAYAYGKNIKALTSGQRTDYVYMEDSFLGAKPKRYAASCVLSEQCMPFNSYALDWASSASRPPSYGSLSPLGTYKALRQETTTVPAYLQSGYTLYYLTNWGSASLCRKGLALLGL